MGRCSLCQREMLEEESCADHLIQFADGDIRAPVAYGDDDGDHRTADDRCHDCGIEPDGIHHPGCDWAECPRCGGQLLGHELGDPEGCSRVIRFVYPGVRYIDLLGDGRTKRPISGGD